MKRSMELLPQVSFSILLALSLQPRHGYEIMQQVEYDSAGKVKLGPGSLYGAIKQLRQAELIEELDNHNNDRRRYYKLSHKGWERLQTEMSYYKSAVNLAKKRLS
jgi:DNA-binding PadR family transcriptional regulator